MDYNQSKLEKYRRNINKFLVIGGIGAFVGLVVTSPTYAANTTAQSIGLYAIIMAAVGMVGAWWNWAAQEDLKSGRTISLEFQDIKKDFGNIISRIKREFDDEFARNQGLESKEDVAVEEKVRIKP
jgi:hypothetical protein